MDEKRKFPRFPVTASVICFRYGRQMTMRTLDISQGGLKLEANFELGVGESLDFIILINGTRIRCRGKILAIEELNYKVQARLHFTGTSSSQQRKLSDYLHRSSVRPFEKRLIGGLFILAGVFLAIMIVHAPYFHSSPNKRVLEENPQLQDDRSTSPVSESKMEAETESRKESIRPEKETVVSPRSSQAGLTQENDIQKSPRDLTSSQLPGVVSGSGAEFQTNRDKPQDSKPSLVQKPESKEVSEKPAKDFGHPSGQQMGPVAASESAPARVTHALIRRSAIALGVEDREPVGISQRVSVSQQRVYCWIHVIDGRGEKVTVRWIGKGRRVAEAHLPVGSNSWRTWAYISLKPSMIGPAQVEILGENGEILKTLSFEITE